MPRLIKHIHAIGRAKKRDVLFVTFESAAQADDDSFPAQWTPSMRGLGES